MTTYIFISLMLSTTFSYILGFECQHGCPNIWYEHSGRSYSLNTCCPCSTQEIHCIPECSGRDLAHKLQNATTILENELSLFESLNPLVSGRCQVTLYNSSVPADSVEIIKHYYRLMTEILLKLTIIRRNSLINIQAEASVKDVLCELKQLLRFVDISSDHYTVGIEANMSSRTRRTIFTCRNLKFARSVLNHMTGNIHRAFNTRLRH